MIKVTRVLMIWAGFVGVFSWGGYIRKMITDEYPPHLGADAMLLAGLVCWAVAALLLRKGSL